MVEKLCTIIFGNDTCMVRNLLSSDILGYVYNEAFNKDKCVSSCKDVCSKLLEVKDGSSKYTVGEAVSIASKELHLSEMFVKSIVCDILQRHYVVESHKDNCVAN